MPLKATTADTRCSVSRASEPTLFHGTFRRRGAALRSGKNSRFADPDALRTRTESAFNRTSGASQRVRETRRNYLAPVSFASALVWSGLMLNRASSSDRRTQAPSPHRCAVRCLLRCSSIGVPRPVLFRGRWDCLPVAPNANNRGRTCAFPRLSPSSELARAEIMPGLRHGLDAGKRHQRTALRARWTIELQRVDDAGFEVSHRGLPLAAGAQTAAHHIGNCRLRAPRMSTSSDRTGLRVCS
jgi:hypothetical protein